MYLQFTQMLNGKLVKIYVHKMPGDVVILRGA